jgi:hypothetical protein
MKPRIDLSQNGRFTIWESSFWNEDDKQGLAVLTSGPRGEKLQVVYELRPTTSNFHYLFAAAIDNRVVTALVNLSNSESQPLGYTVKIEKIDALYTEQVQGNPVPKVRLTPVFQCQVRDPKEIDSVYNSSVEGFQQVFLDLMKACAEKATTPAAQQKLGWGIPRRSA